MLHVPADTSTSERRYGAAPSRQSARAKNASWQRPYSKGAFIGAAQSGESDKAPGAVGVETQSPFANVELVAQWAHVASQPKDSTPPPPLGLQVTM